MEVIKTAEIKGYKVTRTIDALAFERTIMGGTDTLTLKTQCVTDGEIYRRVVHYFGHYMAGQLKENGLLTVAMGDK